MLSRVLLTASTAAVSAVFIIPTTDRVKPCPPTRLPAFRWLVLLVLLPPLLLLLPRAERARFNVLVSPRLTAGRANASPPSCCHHWEDATTTSRSSLEREWFSAPSPLRCAAILSQTHAGCLLFDKRTEDDGNVAVIL